MSEAEVIAKTPEPRTRESLARDLRALGVKAGTTLLVHSSLSELGWVCGGPVAVIQALMDVLTPQGTLVMPAFSGDFSDPALWENPPVPQTWWPTIRASMPAYDPRVTPTRGLGRIAEVFRAWPEVVRSNHPAASFTALGPQAQVVSQNHALTCDMGEESPLARVYDLDGWILLLGVGYENNSSFHLAEYRIANKATVQHGVPVLEAGERRWVVYQDIDLDDGEFPAIGKDFEIAGNVQLGQVGSARSRLFPQRLAVDFAVTWLVRNRLIERA